MYVRVATPPLAGLMQENKMHYNQDMLFTQNNQNHKQTKVHINCNVAFKNSQ